MEGCYQRPPLWKDAKTYGTSPNTGHHPRWCLITQDIPDAGIELSCLPGMIWGVDNITLGSSMDEKYDWGVAVVDCLCVDLWWSMVASWTEVV